MVISPTNRIDQLQLFVTLRILKGQVGKNLGCDAERARTGIADDRDLASVAPLPHPFDDPVRHELIAIDVTLGVPDSGTTGSSQIVRNPERHSSTSGNGNHCIGEAWSLYSV